MKKIFSLFFLFGLILNLNAQVIIPTMELKHNGFVGNDSIKNFVVIEIPNTPKSELYKKTLVYLNTIYVNPQKVLTFVENESIIINGLTETIKGSLPWNKYQVFYRISIQFKDGKIKFEPTIKEIVESGTGNIVRNYYVNDKDSPNPSEINCIWLFNGKDSYFIFNKELKQNTDKWINSYIINLIEGITKNDW